MPAFQGPEGRPGGEVYRGAEGPGAAFSPHGFPQTGASSDNMGNREGEGALERQLSPELAQHPTCQAGGWGQEAGVVLMAGGGCPGEGDLVP